MKKEEPGVVYAKVKNINKSLYRQIPAKGPASKMVYDVIFETEKGDMEFSISEFEYNVLNEGDSGVLVYKGKTIISFADKIKEI